MLIELNETQCVFTCNQDEKSSQDEARTGIKNILLTHEFLPEMKRGESYPG